MKQKIEQAISKYWYISIPVFLIFIYYFSDSGGKGTLVKNTIESVGNIVYKDTLLNQWPKYNTFSNDEKKRFLLLLRKDENKNFIDDNINLINQDVENKTQKGMYLRTIRKIEKDFDSLSTSAN